MIELLTRGVTRWNFKRSVYQVYEGIKICDTSVRRLQAEQHCRRIVAALKIIEHGTPTRFRRIQRHCEYIGNAPLLANAIGAYNPAIRVCCVDMDQLDFEANEELEILFLSTVLIHEGTHGWINSQGIRYDKTNRQRIERICYEEQVRFLKSVGSSLTLDKFDISPWQQSWEKKWPQVAKEVAERLRHF